jgi:hypothetical protein
MSNRGRSWSTPRRSWLPSTLPLDGQRAPVLPERPAPRDAAIPILSDRACGKRPQVVDAGANGTAWQLSELTDEEFHVGREC